MKSQHLGRVRRRRRPIRPHRWLPFKDAWYWLQLPNGVWLLLWWRKWFGICPVELRKAPHHYGEAITKFPHVERSMKKKAAAATPKDGHEHLAAIESDVFSKLSSLVSHCAVTKYDDGDPRKPGWFTIKTQGSSWVVQVKDPDACVSFQAVAVSLDEALVLASVLLDADSTPWEHDPWLEKAKPKSKK